MCAIAYTRQQKAKKQRKKDREWRRDNRTKRELTKAVEKVCHEYIRIRDKDLPCVSCGNFALDSGSGGAYDAGHYFSRGAHPSVRFDCRNIHKQCKKCNRWLSGNIHQYKDGILTRISENDFKELERLSNKVRKYTLAELVELEQVFKTKIKELKNG